ncbi:MAG: MFS transporter [Thermomicrobiales bacterium]
MTPTPATTAAPLWKNRDYLLLWFGQSVSILGTHVSHLAFPLLVLALTGSPAQAGFVAAARSVPWLLFALPAGALVDRWDRKLTMILCGLGSGLALGSIPIAYAFDALTIAQIVIVSFIEGAFALVFGLAETSALPHVVTREQLPTAIAQQQAQYAVGALLGPPLGGALYGAARMLPFLVDALSYAVSACSLRFVRATFGGQSAGPERSLRAEIGEGLTWLWRQPLVRYMSFLTGALNFTAGLDLIIIVLVQRQGASSATIGAMFAIAGAGGVIGALLAPRIQRRFSFGQVIIGLCWFSALVYALFAATSSVALITAILAIYFLAMPAYDTVQLSYRLALIPRPLQGRVNSVFRLVAQGMRPLGLGLTGVLIEHWDLAGTTLALSAWLAAVALLTTLNSHVRTAPVLTEVAA